MKYRGIALALLYVGVWRLVDISGSIQLGYAEKTSLLGISCGECHYLLAGFYSILASLESVAIIQCALCTDRANSLCFTM